MALNSNDDLLGCGRSIDSVWANLGEEPDAHQATCEYCLQARQQLRALYDLTQEVRTVEATEAPDASLTDRIMSAARAEVRRGRRVPLELSPHAVVEASEYAISAVVRSAVDAVPGTVARACRIRVLDEQTEGLVNIGVSAGIKVSETRVIPELQHELRRSIARAVREKLGLRVATVDLVVEDIHGV